MRFLALALAAGALPLSACHRTPEENVEAKTERTSRALEERANQITAEAENGADSAAAPYDNEAGILLNQIAGNVAAATAANGSIRR